jgi:phosphatidylinositol alpha-mannosyltransferase
MNIEEIESRGKNYKDRRKELGIGKKEFVILNVNQIAPDKGIEDVIHGFSLVKKSIPNAKLIIIGKGILEEKMHEMIRKLNLEKDVFHRKNIPEEELYDYHYSSDLFVSAVAGEDFMMSIQEAMVVGLPIVSSAQPFLVKEGVNGHIAGIKNPKGLAEAIIDIYNNKKIKKMGQESKKIIKEFDWKNVANTALEEYKKLEKKTVRVEEFEGKEKAIAIIEEAITYYKENFPR